MALGAGETTLLRLTTAYAMLVNGGKKIETSMIDRVQNRNGKTLVKHDNRICLNCLQAEWDSNLQPQIIDNRDQLIDPVNAYQVVSMLRGAVTRGTGKKVSVIKKPLAGKTGTTNDSNDTWFIGFSPDLVVGIFVGFDTPKTLGPRETGASVASPMFRDFMQLALDQSDVRPFRIPSRAKLIKVNLNTGNIARKSDKNVILETFYPGTEPNLSKDFRNSKNQRKLRIESDSIIGLGGLY